jgi:thiosulfate dehydrogenase [quinone] large subunit
MGKCDSRTLGYATLRLAIGMSMLMHGLNRIGKMRQFADATATMFSATWLPRAAVIGFAYATPSVELLIGLLVFFGFFTRAGLFLGGLWMVALIFGSALIEKYDIVGIQLMYSAIFSVLLYCHEWNHLSLDALRRPGAKPASH